VCVFAGWILIDRCGNHFGAILNFLRDGHIALPETAKEMAELLAEAKYYCISELADCCERALMKKERDAEPICRVPLITSQKEEQHLISSTTKVMFLKCWQYYFFKICSSIHNFCSLQPVVKLLINRHNNKYSYTT